MSEKVHISDLGLPPEKTRRRCGGREARRESRLSESGPTAVKAGVSGGKYKPLSETDVEKVHGAVLEVLETVGIGEPTQEVIDITVPKGAVLSGDGRLCFPRALMEDVLAGAAEDYTVHARGSRAGTDDIVAKDTMVHNAISGQAVTFLDSDSLTYRPSTILDIYNFTRVVDVSEHIHMAGVPVVATDVLDPIDHDINCAYAVMAATEKTFSMSFTSRESLAKGIELFDMVAGGDGKFAEKPFCIFGGCPLVSPLRFGEENLDILIETARRGLTCDLAVAPQAGATAPAALAGTLVQVVAETLAALAIVNLTNPGTPLTFAAWPFVSDLRTGSFSGGSGEEGLLTSASVQMGNWYGLPTSAPACMTDSKIPDAQSGYEKGMTSVLASIAGCNRVSECAGMMGSLMGISLESLVIDNDMLGAAMRVVRGIEVTDETLSVDVIRDVATAPGHYLGHDQTIAMMQTEFLYPSIADRQPQGTWEEQGSPTVFDRAKERVEEILSTHYPQHLAGVDAGIRDAFAIHLNSGDVRL